MANKIREIQKFDLQNKEAVIKNKNYLKPSKPLEVMITGKILDIEVKF